MKDFRAENILKQIHEALPGAGVELIKNASPSGQDSLLVRREDLVDVARFLRDAPALLLDYLSNVSGVDWPGKNAETPGYLEVVSHLYSVAKKHGPLVLRVRTGDRDQDVVVPSLVSVFRSADFQECEVYDLYGVRFEGHPELRRLLMWDEFVGHPMRKDYQP